jgi:lambda family phage minor tail protein L
MTLKADLQSLSPTALLEFFILDATNLPGGTKFYFHAGTNGLQQPVIWQGQTYTPMPIEAKGFDVTAKGTLPRPKLNIANINGLLSAEVKTFNDFVGCKVTRKRTFAKYLDAANFAAGNASADANQYLGDEIWYVERKLTESRYVIEFELSSAFDLIGQQLPSRQVVQSSCPWVYRGTECGYTGAVYLNSNNQPTTQAGDTCSKTLDGCKKRFGTQPIRFGGFPGAVRGIE